MAPSRSTSFADGRSLDARHRGEKAGESPRAFWHGEGGTLGWLGLAALCGLAALAAWLSGGALALVSATSSRRVGLLPGWGVPLAVAVLVFTGGLATRFLRAPRRSLVPLLFLLVLVLPWLPGSVPPAFLIWTGPLIAWVWIATGAGVLFAAWPSDSPVGRRAARLLGDPRRGSLVACGLAFVIYCAAASQLTAVLPSGDEPHYLVITQSLLKDGDLRIENNHRQGDYKAYFPGELRPDYLRRGTDNRIYSIHAPGLAAIVAPAFAAGGYAGVVVFLALMSALGTLLVWRAAYRVTSDAGAAWFGWAAVALTTPFFFHAFTVYPDGLGATIVMVGVLALVELDASARPGAAEARPRGGPTSGEAWRWALRGAALAILPWLHTRHAGAAAVLGACIGLRLLGHRRLGALAAFLVVPIVSAAGWFGYFYAIYGRFSPSAPYGHYTQSSLANIPRALPALFLDQQFGVIPNAPVYAIAIVGLAMLWRRRPRLGAELTLLFVSYLALVAAYHMWWGGRSAAARFAVPVLLSFGVPAAMFWSARRTTGRVAAIVALMVSLLITGSLVLADSGWLIFNSRDGVARWLEWATPAVDLPRALPSFLRGSITEPLRDAGIWLAVLLAATAGLRWICRRPGTDEQRRWRIATGAPWLLAASVMAAATITWRVSGAMALTATSSQLDTLRAFDPDRRPLGLVVQPFGFVPPSEIVQRLEISNSRRRAAEVPGPMLVLGDVPAGTYRLAPGPIAGARGRIEVLIGRSTEPIERWELGGPQGSGGDRLLRLPASANAVTITGDADAMRTAGGLALRPVEIVPPHQRVASLNARRARRYGDLAVFAFDDHLYLEEPGFWIEGRTDARLVVAPDPPSRGVRLVLRNGANPNVVEVKNLGWQVKISLAPQEERAVEIPIDPAKGAALLAVRTEQGFRPADVDPASRDLRYLGVWMQNGK